MPSTDRVEIVVGDLFTSGARLLVAPCSVTGSMNAEVRAAVTRLGAQAPSPPFEPGQVTAVPARSGPTGTVVLFAMAAQSTGGTVEERIDMVLRAARQIGSFATHGDEAAFPLLGAGAGRVPEVDSLWAIAKGFGETADPGARLRLYVRDEQLAGRLRLALADRTETATWPRSSRVLRVAAGWGDNDWRTAGWFASEMFTTELPGLADTGPRRTVAEHLAVVESRWSRSRMPEIGAEAVVLGLALDPPVGEALLAYGRIYKYSAGRRRTGQPTAWDCLSRDGRALAESQPLLAAALGAPAEWTAEVPGAVRLMALAPDGKRVAAVVGDIVYEVAPDQPCRRVGAVDGGIASLAWARDGLVALVETSGGVVVRNLDAAEPGTTVADLRTGLLAAGGAAWLSQGDEVFRWTGPGRMESLLKGPGLSVLAVNDHGTGGLVAHSGGVFLIDDTGEASPFGLTLETPVPSSPHAMVSFGTEDAVVEVTDGYRVLVVSASGSAVAEILTEGPVGALASGGGGRCLAVAVGKEISVWPVSTSVSHAVAGYHADRIEGADLLDTDRDALALAALIASRELRPPLAVGLFGAWGSGKTFVLDQIVARLREFAASHDEGFLGDVAVVPFNAWHYAETNLWASLVDQVLHEIAPPEIGSLPEVAEADRAASDADTEVTRIEAEVAEAEATIAAATTRLVRKRRAAWITGGVVLLFAAAAVVAAALGRSAAVFAVLGAVSAVIGYVAAAAGQLSTMRKQAKEIETAGREGLAVVGRFAGRADEEAARVAAARKADLLEQARAAREEASRRHAQAGRVRAQAGSDQMASVLGQLSTVTEYRDQLSLVTRTRKLFTALDREFRGKRRVVIAIDDLDRCAAEKVVQVLEAVHLLFNFEMFVVVLAVDTRWLDQSLRIRYHRLLGAGGGATPSDYLEKIIQIPMRLVPLDPGRVERMIEGLTGITPSPPRAPAPADPPPATETPPGPVVAAEEVPAVRKSTMPRERRPVLPARLLATTAGEAAAMAEVAPLIGATPRTVKRFVNTFRLLKARSKEPGDFGVRRDGIADHEVVAFLLAVVIGQAEAAGDLLAGLGREAAGTLGSAVSPESPIATWLAAHPRYADAPRDRFAEWAPEVARFSFR